MDTPHILFEAPTTAELFRLLHPDYPSRILSLDELIAPPEGDAEQRLLWLREHLPREAVAQAADFLGALEELREAPLASPDDAEFAFSLLPSLPKNRALK